jgi:hypothetical protein
MYFASGTTLSKFPADGVKVWRSLKDQGWLNIVYVFDDEPFF